MALVASFISLQSARLRAAGIGKDFKENPNLRDNWTDAEGYYRKFTVLINFRVLKYFIEFCCLMQSHVGELLRVLSQCQHLQSMAHRIAA